MALDDEPPAAPTPGSPGRESGATSPRSCTDDAYVDGARRADLREICALRRRAIEALSPGVYTPEQLDAWIGDDDLERRVASLLEALEETILVAARDVTTDTLVGFGQLDPVQGVIEAVYVTPDRGGSGIGVALLVELEQRARSVGLSSLCLDASLNAVPFYERAGYRRVTRASHDLDAGVPLPCMIMSKDL